MTPSKQETFLISFSYNEPGYTSLFIVSDSKEEALKIVTEMTIDLKDVKIIDVVTVQDMNKTMSDVDQLKTTIAHNDEPKVIN